MFVISEEKKWDSWEKKATLSLNTLLRVNNFQKTHRVSVYLTLLSKSFAWYDNKTSITKGNVMK